MTYLWIGFVAFVLAMLALDLGVFHKQDHKVGVKEASVWTGVWITLGLSFSAFVYFLYEQHWFGVRLAQPEGLMSEGLEAASLYVTGYLLEKSLSVDNIFVIALLFETFKVDQAHRHRVLFWGILGALLMRAGMIFGGVWLVSRFDWVFYVFGAYLIFTAVQLLRGEDEDEDAHDSFFVRAACRVLPIHRGEHDGRFIMKVSQEGGAPRTRFTMLFLALVAIEWTDCVFALDSIPAVLAITTEPFLVFTSNIFAILGLRSLFFVLNDMLDRFDALKYALAFILAFIGFKMVAHDFVHIPNVASLGVILGSVVIAVIYSLASEKKAEGAAPEDEQGNTSGSFGERAA